MMTHDQWLERRRGSIGGSDVPILLGLSPFMAVERLYNIKRGIDAGQTTTAAMRIGSDLENSIRDGAARYLTEQLGEKVTLLDEETEFLSSEDIPRAHANLDGLLETKSNGRCVLEIKTTRRQNAFRWEHGVPADYVAQVQHYLAITGLPVAFVILALYDADQPKDLSRIELRHFRLDSDEKMHKEIKRAIADFWQRFDLGEAPAPTSSEGVLYTSLSGDGSAEVTLADKELDDALRFLKESRESKREAEENEKKATKDVLSILKKHSLGSHKNVKISTASHKLTLLRISSTRFNVQNLRRSDPETYSRFSLPTTSYQLRGVKAL